MVGVLVASLTVCKADAVSLRLIDKGVVLRFFNGVAKELDWNLAVSEVPVELDWSVHPPAIGPVQQDQDIGIATRDGLISGEGTEDIDGLDIRPRSHELLGRYPDPPQGLSPVQPEDLHRTV